LQTRDAFGFKWAKRDTYDTPAFRAFASDWYSRKYGFGDESDMVRYFDGRRDSRRGMRQRLHIVTFLRHAAWSGRAMWVGVDISSAVDVACRNDCTTCRIRTMCRRTRCNCRSHPRLLTRSSRKGVLHHTPSTRMALLSAARILAPGGEFLFYVYRRKAPLREIDRAMETWARANPIWAGAVGITATVT
jgi:arsenite methyltransferase